MKPLDARMPPPAVPLPQHTLLPLKAQARLKEATGVEPGAPIGASPARTRAVESATFHARAFHPKLFRTKL